MFFAADADELVMQPAGGGGGGNGLSLPSLLSQVTKKKSTKLKIVSFKHVFNLTCE